MDGYAYYSSIVILFLFVMCEYLIYLSYKLKTGILYWTAFMLCKLIFNFSHVAFSCDFFISMSFFIFLSLMLFYKSFYNIKTRLFY